MPPARTIIVDTAKILQSIAEQAEQQRLAVHAAADAGAAWWTRLDNPFGMSEDQRKERAKVEHAKHLADNLPLAPWVPRNLETLAGKTLTASWRIRTQQAMRKLEADGLVVLDTRHVRLTDAGRAAVEGANG